jgi:NAD+ synthase
MSSLHIDAPRVIDNLVGALADEFSATGFTQGVIGLSGGADSALSAALAARALGPENVLAILMPYRTSSEASVTDALAVVEATGIRQVRQEITPQIDAYFANHEDADAIRRGNKMARERMSILFDHAKRENALVIGTSNRSEILLGYATMFGDNACSTNPIGSLYKTQVWALGRAIGLPDSVIDKAPSADLWAGQTDEEELGFSYASVDPLLVAMFDEGLSREDLIGRGFDADMVDRVRSLHNGTAFKRRLPRLLDWRD